MDTDTPVVVPESEASPSASEVTSSAKKCFICSGQVADLTSIEDEALTFANLCKLFRIPASIQKEILATGSPKFCCKCPEVVQNAMGTIAEMELLENNLMSMEKQLEQDIMSSFQNEGDSGLGVFVGYLNETPKGNRPKYLIDVGNIDNGGQRRMQKELSCQDQQKLSEANEVNKLMFQCSQCPRSFQSQKAKIAHAKVHSKRQSLNCSLCNSFCTSIPKFKQHFVRCHSNITGPVCSLCGTDLSFTSNESCQKEVLLEGEDREVNLAKLHAEHLPRCPNQKTAEPADESYKCAKCNLSFRRKAQLHRHQLSVHDKDDDESDEGVEGPEVIVDADENIVTQSLEGDDGKTVSGTEETKADKPFRCFYCPKSFATENARSGHGKIHGDVKPFRCLICSVGIATLAKFKAHLVQKHPGADESTCPLCNSALNTLTHNGQFQCPSEQCGQKFDSISKVRNHHLAECAQKIENDRKLFCLNCKHYFINEEELGTHRCEQDAKENIPSNEAKDDESGQALEVVKPEVKVKEPVVRSSNDIEEASDPSWSQKTVGKSKRSIRPAQPYRCKICSERFSQLYGLKRHFRGHGRASQASCPLCGINFKSDENTGSDGGKDILRCPLRKCCDRTFDSVAALRAHHFLKCPENPKVKERTRVPKKALNCCHCPSRYSTAEELKQHIDTSHVDQGSEVKHATDGANATPGDVTNYGSSTSEFKCPVCLKKFSKELLMKDHIKIYHKSKPYSCKICRHRFTQVKNLRRHVLQVHRSNAQLMCHYCGEDFKSGGEDRPFECRLFGCDLVFESLSELRSHHFLKCPQNPELKDLSNAAYSCDKCGRLFTTEAYLRNHIISIHQKQDGRVGIKADEGQTECNSQFKCSMCPKKFLVEAALNAHMQSHHQDGKPFQCKVCSMEFNRFISMRKHFLTAHAEIAETTCEYCGHDLGENKDDASGLFRCNLPDDCQLVFQTAGLLRQHHLSKCTMKPNRTNEGAGYTCERCGKSFLGHVALKDHIATIHEKTFKFYCDKCGRGFQKFCELKRHSEFVHSSEKRYECEVCKMRFKRSNQLFYHRRMHTGERPYVCEVCGKSFHIPGKLRSHVALHSGKKEFPCSLCGKFFASKSYVTYHINFTHKGRTRAKNKKSSPLMLEPLQQQEVVFEVTTNPVIEIEFQPVTEHDVHTTAAPPLVFEHLTVVDGTVVGDSLALPCTSDEQV